jgi:hypothetical protein
MDAKNLTEIIAQLKQEVKIELRNEINDFKKDFTPNNNKNQQINNVQEIKQYVQDIFG